MTKFSSPSALGRVPQSAALLVVCLLCVPLALHELHRPIGSVELSSRSNEQSILSFCFHSRLHSATAISPQPFSTALFRGPTSLTSHTRSPLFLAAEAAATNEVVLCLNGEIVYTLALWAARHVNSTWPTTPAYPGNRTELGFRMDVPIRVKSIPYSSLSVTKLTRWYAVNGTDCDVVIGPGWSAAAMSISGLITSEQMWVDPDASSDVLSNKVVYPSFSRIVTPDSQRTEATVRLLNRLGLNHLAIICVRESWSQDLVNSISAMWRNQNPDAPAGALLSIKCMEDQPVVYLSNATMATDTSAIPDSTMSEWDSVIATIAASQIRTVYVAFRMPLGNPHQFLRRLNATRPDLVKERVFVFADTLCGEGGGSSLPFPGALCLSPAVRANALPEYSTRSAEWQAQDKAYYAAVGVPLKDLNSPGAMTEVQTYHAKVYDSTVLALTAQHQYRHAAAAGKRSPDEYPRLITVPNGLTGELSLTSTGDRRSMKTYVYNSNAASSEMEVGYVESDIHCNTGALYLAGKTGVLPSALVQTVSSSPSPAGPSTLAIVVMSVVVLFLVGIVTIGAVYFFRVGKVCAGKPKPAARVDAPGEEGGVELEIRPGRAYAHVVVDGDETPRECGAEGE